MRIQNPSTELFSFYKEVFKTEVDGCILACLFDANLTSEEWDLVKEHMGIRKVVDVLELRPEDFQAVVLFKPLLKYRLATMSDLLRVRIKSSQQSLEGALLCKSETRHQPSAFRRQKRKYWLFAAANDGCVECVSRMLECEKVPLASVTDNQGYTVMSFAKYGLEKDVEGCEAVVKYLEDYHGLIR